MKSDRVVPVAIVGGGASGTILAAQLARRGLASALIDGSGRLGRGVAYSTVEPAHLLNVPADGMSAWAGDPDHFARRYEAEGGDPKGFAERRLFGRYLGEVLDEALASGRVRLVEVTAHSARREDAGWRVELSDGSAIQAQALVLAIGNQQPEALRVLGEAGERFIANPWGAEARAAVQAAAASGEEVLLIGTGLTMIDLVLSLDAAGHRGAITAVSRRGQIPRAHADFDPAPVDEEDVPAGSVRALTRWIRRRAAAVGWRAAIDSLRPHSHPLWRSLSEDQQRRFLRHARPWWDVHRHRIAPDVARRIKEMVAEGRLEIAAGRVAEARPVDRGVEVTIARRGRNRTEVRVFGSVFNCTGPLGAIARTRDELVKQMLADGLIRPDRLGIALDVDHRSRATGAERLWAMGPMTKGRFWEIIAVPDIRVQAASVADDIAKELGQ